ncbi:MAG: 16S rRNA (guanine(527)-N(7))-methyltransferase RsmG [Epsilonproteobacteria bacterium]|nr:16S rRNA (guanine(527)-N(7))-methyltransferase RsmG [Campylobacterota bacterium]
MKNDNLKKELTNINLELDELFFERCEKFKSLLKEWGKVHNLTSPASLNDSDIESNIIDSLYPLRFLNQFDSFADVGTGAGYPGLIMAMAKPEISCMLIEPRAKRAAFLNYVKNVLGLKHVQVLQKRVENVDGVKVELVTSRAVTNTELLLDLTKNISDENTSYLFYKGSICQDEIKINTPQNYEIISVGDYRNYLYIKGKK